MPTLTLVVTKRPHVLLVGLYSLYGGIRFHHMLTMSMLMLTAVPLANCQSGVWAGGIKVNESACKWVVSPDAWVDPGQRQFYKTALCPTGYVQTGSRFMLWPGGLDDEHVDVYCCPFS